MVDIDVLSVTNEYFSYLKQSCGTLAVGELHRLCLLPLLKDITDGAMSFYVTENDERYINNFIRECFSDVIAKNKSPYTRVYQIYSGTSDSYPSNNVILNSSISYASTERRVISPDVMQKYFWIAVPKFVDVLEVANRDFRGDYIPMDYFETFETILSDVEYVVYYTESTIPLSSTYYITFSNE